MWQLTALAVILTGSDPFQWLRETSSGGGISPMAAFFHLLLLNDKLRRTL
jgi:hypothetical protein